MQVAAGTEVLTWKSSAAQTAKDFLLLRTITLREFFELKTRNCLYNYSFVLSPKKKFLVINANTYSIFKKAISLLHSARHCAGLLWLMQSTLLHSLSLSSSYLLIMPSLCLASTFSHFLHILIDPSHVRQLIQVNFYLI